jgi:hypothetical protein
LNCTQAGLGSAPRLSTKSEIFGAVAEVVGHRGGMSQVERPVVVEQQRLALATGSAGKGHDAECQKDTSHDSIWFRVGCKVTQFIRKKWLAGGAFHDTIMAKINLFS